MADSSDPPSSSTSVGGNDFLPSTTLTNRFKNFYRMATGGMSSEGQKKYWSDADERYSEIDCKRCEDQRDYLLQILPDHSLHDRQHTTVGRRCRQSQREV